MKRILLISALILTLTSCSEIGVVSGAELEFIEIGGICYEIDRESSYSRKDRGDFLGYVTDGKHKLRVYELDSPDAIYVLDGYDGEIYRKID